MEPVSILLCAICTLLLYVFVLRQSAPKTDTDKPLPPRQSGLPLLGYVPFMRPNRYLALNNLHKRHGPVFLLPIFNEQMLVIGAVDILREALVEQADVFALRPKFRYAQMMTMGKGIIFQDGEEWQSHRRFILKTLRDLGFAKSLSLNAIHEEMQTLAEFIEMQSANEVETKFIFSKMTNNVICSLVFGQRFGRNDKTFDDLFGNISKLMEIDSQTYENFPFYFPFMLDYPIFMKIYRKFAWREKVISNIHEFISKKLLEQEAIVGTASEPQSLIEAMLQHRQTLTDGNDDFDNQSIVADVFDVFVAGTDTTAATLTWAMALLAVNQDIQSRVREEIRNQIGLEALPTMQDRSKLNYVLAVLDEITRYASIAPTALFHATSRDTTLRGYHIPAGTVVIPNLYAIHRDPKLWRNPHNFDPNNFLDSSGMYRPSDNLVSFSLGKRSCLGESLARMELFVFFVATLKRYEVSLSGDYQKKTDSLLAGDDGLVRHLQHHTINFKLTDADM